MNPIEAAERQRALLLWVLRGLFLVLIFSIALLNIYAQTNVPTGISPWVPVGVPLTFALVLFVGALLIDIATPKKKISTISGVFLGILGGLIVTYAAGFLINLLMETWIGDRQTMLTIKPYSDTIKLMVGVMLCYLGVSIVLQTQDDFRLVIPYVEFAKQIRGSKPNILDTSTLIDARIADLAATGLLQSSMIIPGFVVAELQLLADSSDRLKRARGRRGLDVVTRMQRLGTVDVIIDSTPVTARAVDQMLVELASKLGGRIITTDLGLTRIGQIQGLTVLNLHDIASTLKPALVPGEQLSIRLVKLGEQPGQAVGYLEDGTMVVVDGGAPRLGQDTAIMVSSTMQTTAGRLIFARPLDLVDLAAQDDADQHTPETAPEPASPDPSDQSTNEPAQNTAQQTETQPGLAPSPPQRPTTPPGTPSGGPPIGPGPGKPMHRRNPTPRNPRR